MQLFVTVNGYELMLFSFITEQVTSISMIEIITIKVSFTLQQLENITYPVEQKV